jgi:SAM-dependent methyltransferase
LPRLARHAVGRLARYPPRFLLRHPVRAARNAVGNHPSALADRYLLHLDGVEIGGAAHNHFFLRTRNVDYTTAPSTAEVQRRFAGRVLPVDDVAVAGGLPYGSESFDFVLASHVIEHVPDAIGALLEWARVARRYVFLIIPARTNEFDHARPLTTLEELIDRHANAVDSIEDRHWSVWTPQTFRQLCEHLGLRVLEIQDPDDKRGNGFAVVLEVGA